MAARLELRARAENETTARDVYVQLFAVAPGEHVLDGGCGSGVVMRALAQRVAPDGRVVGGRYEPGAARRVWGAPDHVAYTLIEADTMGAVGHYVKA